MQKTSIFRTDILFKKDSDGNVRVHWFEVFQTDHFGICIVESNYGRLHGTKSKFKYEVREGKNIGKSNETTIQQQAILECRSAYNDVISKGGKSLKHLGIGFYVPELTRYVVHNIRDDNHAGIIATLMSALPAYNTDADDKAKPMKAQPYFKDNGDVRISFPCFGQPKINGVRATVQQVCGTGMFDPEFTYALVSKEGTRYSHMTHIIKQVGEIFTYEPYVFDGELWLPTAKFLSETVHAVKSQNGLNQFVNYYIFDIAEPGMSQLSRIQFLDNIVTVCGGYLAFEHKFPNIRIVRSRWIADNIQAQEFTDECISYGFEGAIFRNPDAYYEFGRRPKTMVKLKRHSDAEYLIVDIVPMDKYPEQGMYVCRTEYGETFLVTPKMTHLEKAELLANKEEYIGKLLTVKFFEFTKNQIPFHGVGISVRDYE